MHMDPIMPLLVGIIFAIFTIGLMMRFIRQPYAIGYLISGILLGPHVLNLIPDPLMVARLGEFGVILLLFFVGMEISLPRLLANWRIAILGTTFQIVLSLSCVLAVGLWWEWSLSRVILLGFVVSLSSTVVVLKLLDDWGESDTEVGQDVLGVLLMQDLAIIPMLIIINVIGGHDFEISELILQAIGGLTLIIFLVIFLTRSNPHLPFANTIRNDREMQVFAAMIVCFGVALLTAVFHLSTALGAFVGGIIIGTARETEWVHESLEPFRIVFIAIFFVSIGMLVNLKFVLINWKTVGILVVVVFLLNTAINSVTLRLLGLKWRRSLYSAAILAQIGEFSFVLAAVGLQSKIITDFGYQMAIAVITMTLLLSPMWIRLIKGVTHAR